MSAVSERDSQVFTLRMPKAEYEALRLFAFMSRCSMNDVILKAIRQHLTSPQADDEFEMLLAEARTRYRGALDKLANL